MIDFSLSEYRIIEPLASRCAKFRFKPLSEDIMSSRILHISSEEGLTLDSEVCKLVVVFSCYLIVLLSFCLLICLTNWPGYFCIELNLSRGSSPCYHIPAGVLSLHWDLLLILFIYLFLIQIIYSSILFFLLFVIILKMRKGVWWCWLHWITGQHFTSFFLCFFIFFF